MKHTSKRTLALILSVAMLLPLLILPVSAEASYYADEDFEEFEANTTLTMFDGFAEMPTYHTVKEEKNNNFLLNI